MAPSAHAPAARRSELVPLILVLVLAACVAVLAGREGERRLPAPPPKGDEPLWLRYLEAGLDPQDALWVRYSEQSRAAYGAGRFREAEGSARAALAISATFPSADARRPASEELLTRAVAAREGLTANR